MKILYNSLYSDIKGLYVSSISFPKGNIIYFRTSLRMLNIFYLLKTLLIFENSEKFLF